MWRHDLLNADEYRAQSFAYAHVKRDGHRLACFVQQCGQPVCVTSLGTELDVRWAPWYLPLARAIPPMTSLDGELWYPGKPASHVKTALKERDPTLRWSCFAVPFVNNIDWALAPLEHVEDSCKLWGIDFVPWQRTDCRSWRATEMLDALPRDQEGWVLKAANYARWYKLKPTRTIDLVCTGFTEAKGDLYLGLVGSLRGSIYGPNGELVEVASAGGLSEATRLAFNERLDVGRIFEAKYQYVGAGGRLRHPRFMRWREDKDRARCTVLQDSQLEEYYSS